MSVLAYFEAAVRKRKLLIERLEREGTDGYRLFCGELEGVGGLRVDRLGPVAFVQRFDGKFRGTDTDLQDLAEWCRRDLGVSVCLKPFAADRNQSEARAIWLAGDPLEEFAFRENGLRFLIRPGAGFSTGIFLDQRDHRKVLASGGTMLNLFAYTGAFSVYAAKAGAETTTVDLSKKTMEWAKRNFELNGLSGGEFFASDAFQFLKGAKKRGRKFDSVVVDPPSFSRDRDGNVFSIAKDAGRLAEAAAEVVSPGGTLFFSTNYEGWTLDEFRRAAGLERLGASLPLPPVPEDFRDQEHPLLAHWIRVS